MSEKSSKKSLKYLEKLGVNVLTNTIVKNYDEKMWNYRQKNLYRA